MIRTFLAALIFAASMPATGAAAPARVDHVIIGVYDLRTGMAELERMTGVRPVFGGVHPGRGTQNALLSLGSGTYLELLAANPAERVRSTDVLELSGLKKPTPIGWAVSGDNLNSLRRRVRLAGVGVTSVNPGSRRRRDGVILHWQTFGYARLDDPGAPFFIIWNDRLQHPSRTSPAGCQLKSLTITTPQAPRLRQAIASLALHVVVRKARQSGMKVAMDCPKGRVVLG